MITVSISKAILCIAGQCFPALVGNDTPTGTFPLQLRLVASPGYGGEVIQFKETDREWFAIHRVWNLKPEQRRQWRLNHGTPAQRTISAGCINVSDEAYNLLRKSYRGQTVRIEK